jgi:MraZ protein
MLRGSALAKVDEKGRLKLPAPFRIAIDPKYGTEFFVTSLRGDSIRIYPMDVWLRRRGTAFAGFRDEPFVMRFKNAVNYYGQTASIDGQGRLLVHPLLRERAAVRGEVVSWGSRTFLEVWNRATFESRLTDDPLTDNDLSALSELGI